MTEVDENFPVTKGDLKALEEKVDLKLGSLKAWGVAALLGGQALAGLLASLVAPRQAQETVEAVLRVTPFF